VHLQWRAHAACRHCDPELFFPIGTGEVADRQAVAAKTVCRRCPVIATCLEWATTNGPVAGVWGGTTELERAAARREDVKMLAAGQVCR
jgi:WhiB family redox-sensing transcriptional regulator